MDINKIKPVTWADAQEKGKLATAVIHGKSFDGYTYEGYFFHHVACIGVTKILIQHCEKVEEANCAG